MDDDVGLAAQRGLERPLEAGEEVGAAAAAVDPRPVGQIEAEMGVGDEEDPERPSLGRGHTHLSTAWSRSRESLARRPEPQLDVSRLVGERRAAPW